MAREHKQAVTILVIALVIALGVLLLPTRGYKPHASGGHTDVELTCSKSVTVESNNNLGPHVEELCHVTDDRVQLRVNCADSAVWCDDEGS